MRINRRNRQKDQIFNINIIDISELWVTWNMNKYLWDEQGIDTDKE